MNKVSENRMEECKNFGTHGAARMELDFLLNDQDKSLQKELATGNHLKTIYDEQNIAENQFPSSDENKSDEDKRDASPLTETSQLNKGKGRQMKVVADSREPGSTIEVARSGNEHSKQGGGERKRRRNTLWTKEEDALLEQLLKRYGEGEWWRIAEGLKGRTPSQVRTRYRYFLLEKTARRTFSEDEDRFILSEFSQHGNKWGLIASNMDRRTANSVNNRYRYLMRQEKKRQPKASNTNSRSKTSEN
uniref:Uncharacterized protein n=1 Tax=Timspurckia oligopyrenoides TaxID=708627 RepID=A0A7S0ZJ88_9RHOD|mmetsp:Transcript_7414/g.13380  ORF Transcript_7414/g.13380 Transcript_7414/m.13380 type:complete len:247 (+) Transcript_7414:168-908(+)